MSNPSDEPILLEAQLKWTDLTVDQQTALIQSVKTNDYSHFEQVCDVEYPSLFHIHFQANLVDSRHPANSMLQSRVFVRPKVTEVRET